MLNLYDHLKNQGNHTTVSNGKALLSRVDAGIFDESGFFWSPWSCVFYTLRGRYYFSGPDWEAELRSGQAVFARKGAHRLFGCGEEDPEVLVFFIPDAIFRKDSHVGTLLYETADAANGIQQISLTESLNTFFQSLVSYFVDNKILNGALLETKLREFTLLLFGEEQANAGIRNHIASICRSDKPDLLEIMSRNCLFNLTEEEFATICGREVACFRDDFEAIFNCSPTEWLIEKRLEHSRIMLLSTETDLETIGRASGFETTAHFIRSFKRKFGMPPAKFRSTHVFG